MIADIYKQGFGSHSGLISKRSSRDSLPYNHNLIYFQHCTSVILNVLAHKISQNSIYRHLWLSRALINHPARPKIVDAPLTLIFRMGQGACLFFFWVRKRPIHPLWTFASNHHLDYSWCKTKNHWRAVDYHVQNGATSVSLLCLGINAADSSEKDNSE
jgi:hypothetical protein